MPEKSVPHTIPHIPQVKTGTFNDVAATIQAKLTLKDFDMDRFNAKVPTLKKYAQQWLQFPHKKPSARTRAKYARNLELHVYPVLGNRSIDQIKRKDLKTLFDELITKGALSESNIQNLKSPLSKIFQQALDDEIIEASPVSNLIYSNDRTVEIKPLNEEQAFDFLTAAKTYEDGIRYPQFLTLLRTGLRVGELMGLQWDDIDFDKRQITVQRHLVNGEIIPKTKNGKTRVVDMTPHLCETLKALKRQKQKDALRRGTPFCEWCFTVGNRTKPVSEPKIRTDLHAILEKAGMPHMRIHDLRHSYATIRLTKGHNVGDVSYQLGHSSIKITFDTYTHWIPGSFQSEIDDLDMHPNAPQTHPEVASGNK